MFKKTLLLALAAIAAMPSWAIQNSVQIANQTIAQSTTQATLTVSLTNNVEISDMQFDLYLPTGFSVAYDEDDFPLIAIAGGRTTDKKHSIDYLARTDGSMRVMCTSSKGYTFSGNSGQVLEITVNVASTVAAGTYNVELKQIRISNSETTYSPENTTSTITVEGGTTPPTPPTPTTGNSLALPAITTSSGATSAVLAVELNNEDVISDLQFDLYLPTGFSVAYDEDDFPLIAIAGGRTTDKKHSIDYLARTDGSMRVMCTSSKGYTFSGNSGQVMAITLNVAGTVAVGTYNVELKQIRLSNSETTYSPENITSTITVDESASPTEPDTDLSQFDNVVYAPNVTAKVGTEVEFPINMKNSIEATGFQFDLYLPEGITVAEEDDFPLIDLSLERTTRKKTDYFNSEYQTDGSLRVLCNSTKGYAFSGNDGEVAIATLNIAANLEDGDYPVILKNIIITDATGNERHTVDRVKSTITIESYLLGDANGDGNVDVSDFSAIAAKILGHPADNFVEKAADINGDSNIDVSDLSGLAYMILHPDAGSAGSKAFRTVRIVGADPDYSTMADTDPATYNNTIYASKATGKAGQQTTLTLNMLNNIEATGFQFDLYLPEGVSFAIDDEGFPMAELSLERTTTRRTDYFNSEIQTDGALRVLCNSTKGYAFSGNDGEVAIVTLNLAATLADGDYPIVIKNIVVTDATGNERFAVEMMKSTLTVGDVAPVYDENYNLQIIPFQIAAGTDDTSVDLLMQNKDDGEINMVDFDLVLPAGINLYQEDGDYIVDAGSRFASSTIRNRFACDVDENSDGTLHISAYFTRTTASYVFSGTSGDIALLTLVADDALADGIYTIELKNIKFNDDSSIQIAPYKTSVFVGKPEVVNAVLYGNYTEEAVDALNACLSADGKLVSIDMSQAAAIEDDVEILPANTNCLIYIPDGAQLANTENVVAGNGCSNLVLTDGEPFGAVKDFVANTATYTRNVTSKYGTICVPYAVSSDASVKYYTLDRVDGSTLYLAEETEIAAGVPAVFENLTDGGTISATAANAAIKSTAVVPTGGDLKLIGTYEKLVITDPTELAKSYYISKDQFHQATNSLTVNPFRAYFTYTGGNASKVFDIAADDEPTMVNGKWSMLDNGIIGVYNANGMKQTALQKGVNIVKYSDGKTQKIIVR